MQWFHLGGGTVRLTAMQLLTQAQQIVQHGVVGCRYMPSRERACPKVDFEDQDKNHPWRTSAPAAKRCMWLHTPSLGVC